MIKKVNYHKKYKLIILEIYNDKLKILTEVFYSKKNYDRIWNWSI